MHDGMQYDPIQYQGQGHEPVKAGRVDRQSRTYYVIRLYIIKWVSNVRPPVRTSVHPQKKFL